MELGRPDRDRDQPPPPRRVKPPEMGVHGQAQHHQPPPPQKCPRCDSNNTKFCYYNNYSLSQPRYFCKGCRRYWTHGGTLRNVPVGGGCRKSKRPKQSTPMAAASSSGGTQPPSAPSIPGSMNPTAGILSGQSLIRALPPVMPSIGNSFYTGGGVLSSLGAIQTLPAGIMSQAPPVNFTGAGAGGHYGANMAILQGLNLPSLKSTMPLQFQSPHDFFPSQQSFNFPARPLNPWTTQGFLSRDQASTSSNTTTANFWNGSATDGGTSSGNINPAGSSFAHNRWTDKHLGFDPSE